MTTNKQNAGWLGVILALGVLAIPTLCIASNLTEQLRCTEIRFSQTVETKDVVAFKAMIHPDVRWLTGAGVVNGPDAVAQAWSALFSAEGPQIAWRPEMTEVLKSGDLALSRGPYRLTGTNPDGETVERWGLFQSVWRKNADNQWLIVFDAGAEDGMQPTDAQRALFEAGDECKETP